MSAIQFEKRNIVSKANKLRGARNSFIGEIGRNENPTASSDGVSLESPSGRLNFLLSGISDIQKNPGTNRIAIYTNDCLRDYYFLKKEGVRFLNEPSYTTDGMAVDFIDHRGNTYLLVEERTYIED